MTTRRRFVLAIPAAALALVAVGGKLVSAKGWCVAWVKKA
jgi:hypothetical protein